MVNLTQKQDDMLQATIAISSYWLTTVVGVALIKLVAPQDSGAWIAMLVASGLFGVFYTAMCYGTYLQRRKNHINYGT